MKALNICILFMLFFSSCDKKIQEQKKVTSKHKISVPLIEKYKNDQDFRLNNGVLLFDEKPYSGTVKDFYADKKLKSTSEYYQGKKHGKFFGSHKNGNKWFHRFYTNGIKTGTHIGWFKDGQQMFEYQLNNNGAYNGSVKDWHYNGQLAKHFNFVDGKETGGQKLWNPDGKIRSNFYTVNNERHGLIGLKNCVSVIDDKTKATQ